MPTAAPTARAVAALSPVSSTGRRPRARSRATAAAAESLTVSVTANAPRSLAVPGGQHGGAAVFLPGPAPGGQVGRDGHAAVREQAGPADDDLAAVHQAAGAEAGEGLEAVGGG